MDDVFLVVYGDTLFHVDLYRFLKFHHNARPILILFLHPNDHPYDSDLVEQSLMAESRHFTKRPTLKGHSYRNLVNAALYRQKKLFRRSSRGYLSISSVTSFGNVQRGGRLFGDSSEKHRRHGHT